MILVVDNRDSYTFNLVQLLRELSEHEVRVVDAGDTDAVAACIRSVGDPDFAGLVISPGPGHPGGEADFGGSRRVLEAALASRPELPILGVCLGHQGLALHFGGAVSPAPEARHGWRSPLSHDGTGPFAGLPQGTLVTRYHSLAVEEPLPVGLRVTARSEDGVVQGLEVEGRPVWGVQFHPESIASEAGRQLIANFVAQVPAPPAHPALSHSSLSCPSPQVATSRAAKRVLHVAQRTVRAGRTDADARDLAEHLAASLYSTLIRPSTASVWIDVPDVTGRRAQWSILADDTGLRDADVGGASARVLSLDGAGAFDAVRETVESLRPEGGEGLPFRGGLLGYFGYELGIRMLGGDSPTPVRERPPGAMPEAWWLQPARAVFVELETGAVIAATFSSDASLGRAAADALALEVDEALSARRGGVDARPRDRELGAGAGADADADAGAEVEGRWCTSRAQYAADIGRCREHLLAGDSYELCLTNEFRPDPSVDPDPLTLFLRLRASDPAPYAALLEFDGRAIVSASPERFLRGTPEGDYETKPIKGTAARASDPAADEAAAAALVADPKVFAENLMIVDLLRNDLGRVCEPGSVVVPSLMAVESYATVHQLVTTVRGSAPGVPPLDVVRALFPGGSMTGAPKLRSVELLRAIERRDRGPYSGALGMLGADGTTELSIVIRSAVKDARGWSIGAGGAIVLASDTEEETREVELKASALRRAFARV